MQSLNLNMGIVNYAAASYMLEELLYAMLLLTLIARKAEKIG